MATSLQSQNERDFRIEVKRIGGKFQSVVNVIDDEYCNTNISNAFADKNLINGCRSLFTHTFLYFSLDCLDMGLLQIIYYWLRWFLFQRTKNNV